MQWMLMPLRRYADFEGRSCRREYWLFALGLLLFYIVVMATVFAVDDSGSSRSGGGLPFVLFSLAGLGLVIPSIAVQVRRFHDQDRSGWLVLLGLIPVVGGLIVLVFMCLPGTIGGNRFGPDPLGRDLADTFG